MSLCNEYTRQLINAGIELDTAESAVQILEREADTGKVDRSAAEQLLIQQINY